MGDGVDAVLVRVRGLEQTALKYCFIISSKQQGKTHRKLQVKLSAAGLDLLRMVEPLDLAHHAGLPRLPEHLDLPDVGPVAASGGEKDRAVVDVQDISAPLDGLEEKS